MVDKLNQKILKTLREKKEGCTQKEIKESLKLKIDRAILLGYLRCLRDTGKIKIKKMGVANGYFIK